MAYPTLSPAERRSVLPDEMSLRDARAVYFARSGFDDATYTDTWVRLPVGPFTLLLPNLPARRRAVRAHDLNHAVTGYGSDWTGEAEISGFEIGTGMGPYPGSR